MNYVIITLLIVSVFWYFFIKPKKSKPKKVAHGKFHCVTVHFSNGACKAARDLEGKRILSSEAPIFPLTRCDVDHCNCRFEHHEERRVEERRDAYHKAMDDVLNSTMTIKSRSETDRRKSS